MAECGVVRCASDATTFRSIAIEDDSIEVSLCAEHDRQIDQGIRWELDLASLQLAMGEDLVPILSGGLRLSRVQSSSEGVGIEVELRVIQGDGSPRSCTFFVTLMQAQMLGCALVSGRRRHRPDSGGPASSVRRRGSTTAPATPWLSRSGCLLRRVR